MGCLHYAHQWSTFPCKRCCRAVSLWRNLLWLLCSIENETAPSDELIEVMAVSAQCVCLQPSLLSRDSLLRDGPHCVVVTGRTGRPKVLRVKVAQDYCRVCQQGSSVWGGIRGGRWWSVEKAKGTNHILNLNTVEVPLTFYSEHWKLLKTERPSCHVSFCLIKYFQITVHK